MLFSITLFILGQSALWYKYISLGGMLYVIPSCVNMAMIVL